MNQYTSDTSAVSQSPALSPPSSPLAPQRSAPPITLKTLFAYLVGSRRAIELIAASPQAVLVGLLFVLSAGLAREYDGEYLLAEPYHLLLPLAASLATSFVLYVMLSGSARCWRDSDHWWIGYARFLGLYWMTAPLAWLYAIPVERFLSAYDATVANLSLLAVVSLWRIALMIRVVSVLFQSHVLSAAIVVLLFADIIVIPATGLISLSTISVMGGIRLTETERLIADVSVAVFSTGLLTLPVWFIGASYVFGRGLLRWPEREAFGIGEGSRGPNVARSLWSASTVLFAFGLALLPAAQAEQRRRHQVDEMIRRDDVHGAIALMASLEESDFPPHWDPPPLRAGDIWATPLIDIVEALVEADATEWLWNAYRVKLDAGFSPIGTFYGPGLRPEAGGTDGEVVKRWIVALDKMSDGEQFTRDHARVFRDWLNDQQLTVEEKERVRVWMLRCDVKNPTPTNKRKDAID